MENLKKIISLGEDSYTQFKVNIANTDKLNEEFYNSTQIKNLSGFKNLTGLISCTNHTFLMINIILKFLTEILNKTHNRHCSRIT